MKLYKMPPPFGVEVFYFILVYCIMAFCVCYDAYRAWWWCGFVWWVVSVLWGFGDLPSFFYRHVFSQNYLTRGFVSVMIKKQYPPRKKGYKAMRDYVIRRKVTNVFGKALVNGELKEFSCRISGHRSDRLKTDVGRIVDEIFHVSRTKFEVTKTEFFWEYVSIPENVVDEYGTVLKYKPVAD